MKTYTQQTTSGSRSALYGQLADQLTATCAKAIDANGRSVLDSKHGSPSAGHIAYGLGELYRCRTNLNLRDCHARDLIGVLQKRVQGQLDLNNEVHRCFVGMGLGLMGPADRRHPVLGEMSERSLRNLRDGLVITHAFDNNWEAFNGTVLMGRHLLFHTPAEAALPHFEKIAAKYDKTGYFDDTADQGNYNNYGLMSINYALHAAECLDKRHPLRLVIEERFKPHTLRYIELIRALTSPQGDTWPFGRSAGALGLLQSIALVEQCLSKQWIAADDVNPLRSLARQATRRMLQLYWDETQQWFNFRDDWQQAYEYRSSLPMAWDMLRYFLQLEAYAASDEEQGPEEKEMPFHPGPGQREIVTNPDLKTAIYIWSDGTDHAVLPVMGGPHRITGDALARPYAPGLLEWTTQQAVPALCPRVTMDGTAYWPAWRAARTELTSESGHPAYRIFFAPLYSGKGVPCTRAVRCEATFLFSSRQLKRIDRWQFEEPLHIDEFLMAVLQPEKHPKRSRFPEVPGLKVSWTSDIAALQLRGPVDVSTDPSYINYHCRFRRIWKIEGEALFIEPGSYRTELQLDW